MSNILLVEPDYRSKFPPLGLLKIASYHNSFSDNVTLIRGRNEDMRSLRWHRIYISSLYTWELPRTVKTVQYYASSVTKPENLYVGGIGATLKPDFIREKVDCNVIEGPLDKKGLLGPNSHGIAEMIPDYTILDNVEYNYQPKDAYFIKITKGCMRSCEYCAVPILEKEFAYLTNLKKQIKGVNRLYGERQNMVILDNNVLGINDVEKRITEIRELGFERGAKRNKRKRYVDFNQGLDARIISNKPSLALSLGSICLDPVRLAFDVNTPKMENAYRQAIKLLSDQGFKNFTNYMLFNYNDTPHDLYHRIFVNAELSKTLGVRVTGFPMRYIPITSISRGYISGKWHWKYLRGLQCILLATHGLISPNEDFIHAAFGSSFEEFIEILAMPDHYIIFRNEYKNKDAKEWKKLYNQLPESSKKEFLDLLFQLNFDRNRKKTIRKLIKYRALIEHYYPNGESLRV